MDRRWGAKQEVCIDNIHCSFADSLHPHSYALHDRGASHRRQRVATSIIPTWVPSSYKRATHCAFEYNCAPIADHTSATNHPCTMPPVDDPLCRLKGRAVFEEVLRDYWLSKVPSVHLKWPRFDHHYLGKYSATSAASHPLLTRRRAQTRTSCTRCYRR